MSTRRNVLKPGYAHQPRDLSSDNADSRTGHESTDGGSRDELDKPSQAKETDSEDDESSDEGKSCGDLWATPTIWVRRLDMLDYLSDRQGHDSNRTNRDILGSCKELGREIE